MQKFHKQDKKNSKRNTSNQEKMLHILTIVVRQITHVFVLAIKNSQILMFSRITFQERRKFGYHFRFLEEKPLDFICAS